MEYKVEYSVTATFRGEVSVTAESEEEAREQVGMMDLDELEAGHKKTDVWSTETYKAEKDE